MTAIRGQSVNVRTYEIENWYISTPPCQFLIPIPDAMSSTPGNCWAVKMTAFFLKCCGFWPAESKFGEKIMKGLVVYTIGSVVGALIFTVIDLTKSYGDVNVSSKYAPIEKFHFWFTSNKWVLSPITKWEKIRGIWIGSCESSLSMGEESNIHQDFQRFIEIYVQHHDFLYRGIWSV